MQADGANDAFLDWIVFIATDPLSVGSATWVSLIITTLGLAFALWQLNRTRRAAEAARDAAFGMRRTIISRERLVELNNALSLLETGQDKIARREYKLALLCLDISRRDCARVVEMLEDGSSERRALRRAVRRIAALAEALMVDEDGGDFGSAVERATEARAIAEILHAQSGRLRYMYDVEGTADEAR